MTTPQEATAPLTTYLAALDARVTALEGEPPPEPPDPEPGDLYLPVSYPDLDAALAAGLGGGRPRESFVLWPDPEPPIGAGGGPWTLEDQFRAMRDTQVLVLPQRGADNPFWIDSADGFVASGVVSVHDSSLPPGEQDIPISSTWHGKGGRTWFAFTRVAKGGGILGLGPGAVVDVIDSGFTRPPQGTEDDMTYTNSSGQTYGITGCQERLIDSSSADTYFGNFTLRCSPGFGGVAYCGLGVKNAIVENMLFDGCWHGHGWAPNSETGAFSTATHTLRNTTFDCTGVGKTSVVMANRAGPSRIEHVRILDPDNTVGSITYWESVPGTSVWNDVNSPHSVNMEANGNGGQFALEVHGGSLGGNQYQVNLRSPYTSQRVELHDVENTATGTDQWVGNNWGNAPYMQSVGDLVAWDADGNPQPTKMAGNTADGQADPLSLTPPNFQQLVVWLLRRLRHNPRDRATTTEEGEVA